VEEQQAVDVEGGEDERVRQDGHGHVLHAEDGRCAQHTLDLWVLLDTLIHICYFGYTTMSRIGTAMQQRSQFLLSVTGSLDQLASKQDAPGKTAMTRIHVKSATSSHRAYHWNPNCHRPAQQRAD